MYRFFVRLKLAVFTGILSVFSSAALGQELVVYTYDSFVSDWGPGPAVEAAFERQCGCDLTLVGAGDGAALLARIRLEGERSEADVVLGLDTNLTDAAQNTGLFAPHGKALKVDLPASSGMAPEWTDTTFIPYDWGYFAFVYDNTKMQNVPENFRALGESDTKIIIQDPRSSTPGLGLLLWVKAAYGDAAGDIWAELSDNIVTVTKGWSEAYGMFLAGEGDMVLSYTTSPAYHIIAEADQTKSAARFSEGHYMQIEVAGKLAATDQPALADQFLDFIMTEDFQEIIPTTNWMYPAFMPSAGLPEGFEEANVTGKALIYPSAEVPAKRKAALDEWLEILSR